MPQRLPWCLFAGAAVAFLVAGVVSYGFRVEREDNPSLGRIAYLYRWGTPSRVVLDVNRDGVVDLRARIDAPFGPYSPHTIAVLEYWESSRLDGFLDRHFFLSGGNIVRVEIDTNSDGEVDLNLEGKPARDFYTDLNRDGASGNWPTAPPEPTNDE